MSFRRIDSFPLAVALGVPAATFMMRAKTLIKSIAQTGKPLARVFSEANDVICEGNSSSTF